MRKLVLVMVAAGMAGVWAAVAVAQETTQPASQPTTEPMSEPTSGPTIRPAVEPATQPEGEPVSQPTTAQAARDEEMLQVTAEKRTKTVLDALALTDPSAQAQVRDVLIAFYVKRITWGPNDDKIKDLNKQLAKATQANDEPKVKELTEQLAGLQAERAAMHQALLTELGKTLTPERIGTVKDAMTYGRAKLLFNHYTAEHALTDAQKAVIAKLLADAREQAWMLGSSDDKHKVFDKAVGKVNTYLDALSKLDAARSAIQAGRLSEAEELLTKIEARDWLKEAMGQPLLDARRALEAAKVGGRGPTPGATP
ncbi:MAG: DUF3826 domain-containing protein [Phycisphaerae bacterium]|nr:DUF3826 domain-containing protein [Phycisphaerae bacterium]